MARVRLELEKIIIHRPKERWNLYFVIVAEHPTDPDKMIVTVTPDPIIKLKPASDNVYNFEASGSGAEGFLLLRRDMPVNRELNVHFYLRHSRKRLRKVGEILSDLDNGMGGKSFGIISKAAGVSQPWLVIAKEAISLVGNILSNIPDRDMGFISMWEKFGPEFESQTELDRENNTTTKEATLVWSWAIDN